MNDYRSYAPGNTLERYMDEKFDPIYVTHTRYRVILVIFVLCGVGVGLDLWKKIWDHRYDSAPFQTH